MVLFAVLVASRSTELCSSFAALWKDLLGKALGDGWMSVNAIVFFNFIEQEVMRLETRKRRLAFTSTTIECMGARAEGSACCAATKPSSGPLFGLFQAVMRHVTNV